MKSYQRGAPRRGMEHPAQGNALGLFGHTSFRALKGQKLSIQRGTYKQQTQIVMLLT